MLSHLVEADGQFLTQLQFVRKHNRVILEPAEYQPVWFVEQVNNHPHPLAFAGALVGKLNLDEIAGLKMADC